MIKALITGMTGMVGSHLADYLLRETDWDIYGMQRWIILNTYCRLSTPEIVYLCGMAT